METRQPVHAPAPGLAITYPGHQPGFLERMLPLVEFIEVTPDTIADPTDDGAVLDREAIAELRAIGGDATIVVHGVGLTIGSHDGWSERYVRLLDRFLEQVDVAWHSEHLGYTSVDGDHLGTMLPPPRTESVLAMVCDRIEAIQRRYGLPFLLENVIQLLPDYPGDYGPAAFFNAVVARTGCGLLLDAYNLDCDAHNQALDIEDYLAELDLSQVREIHVANGMEHRGFLLDIHSRVTRDSTIAIARQALARAGGAVAAVTFELVDDAVPLLGLAAITAELQRLRGALLGAEGPWLPISTSPPISAASAP